MDLTGNIKKIRAGIDAAALASGRDPASVTLLAATKTQSSDTIRAAVKAGVTVCGENRVQELTAHLADNAYEGAAVHFIGHLQTNKVKQVVGRVDLIESIDSLHLLQAVSDCAVRLDRVQDILLEVNIAGETSKSGFSPSEVLFGAEKALKMPGVRLRGVMCIPPAAQDVGGNRKFFQKTYQIYVDIINKMVDNRKDVDCLSMGMSRDFADAVREGATLVRVGTGLFGPRG